MKTHLFLSTLVLSGLTLPLAAQNTINPASGPTPTISAGTGSGATGTTSTAETTTAAPVRQSMFQTLDLNADGVISRAEFESYRTVQNQSSSQAGTAGNSGSGSNGNAIGSTTNFGALDSNSDGVLSPAEFARSSYAEGSETTASVPSPAPVLDRSSTTTVVTNNPLVNLAGPRSFATADTNGDGYITLQEFERYHNAVNQDVQASTTGNGTKHDFATSFRALDSDSDGKLSAQEFIRANARGDLEVNSSTAPSTSTTTTETTTSTVRAAR